MAGTDNLTPFPPGKSGNPNGRPKGRSFKKIMDELLEKLVKDDGIKSAKEIVDMYPDGEVTYKEALAARMIAKAILDPESKSAERLMNRVEGTPIQTIKQNLEVTEIEVKKTVLSKKSEPNAPEPDKPDTSDEDNG